MSATRRTIISEANYSRVVEDRVLFPHAIETAGMRYIWLAGQLAFNKTGQIVGNGDMRAQLRQTALNIKSILERAGAGLDDVIKIVFYVTDMDEYFRCFDVRMEFFGKAFPVSTSVEVSRLAVPGAMIEIEAIAAVPDRPRAADADGAG